MMCTTGCQMLINPCIILCQPEDKSTDRPGGHGRIATLDLPMRARNVFRRLRMSVSTYVCLFARLRRNCLTEWIQISAALCDTDLQMTQLRFERNWIRNNTTAQRRIFKSMQTVKKRSLKRVDLSAHLKCL